MLYLPARLTMHHELTVLTVGCVSSWLLLLSSLLSRAIVHDALPESRPKAPTGSNSTRVLQLLSPNLKTPSPLPVVVPCNLGRCLSLHPRVLDRHSTEVVHALLLESDAVEVALAVEAGALGGAELLTGVVDALVLAHELALVSLAGLALVEEPGAVDSPVSEIAVASHAEGRGREAVEVAAEDLDAGAVLDARSGVLGLLLGRLGPGGGGGGESARGGPGDEGADSGGRGEGRPGQEPG
ncbi:hypothetical protein B0T11DRAFT_49634 [Plectosphaerella cucumerina]|uniref:Uncharacterized protein n=1 Tax=Plectosphaerella cucumerina TaxID=40658 RepID=A0A8K0TKU2_9PEZI|nr:hypothetical protein B0T11DRAFT_49634 [Plectosphaerella cucumerina]